MSDKTGFDYIHLLKTTLDNASDLIQVLKAARNEHGVITDFIYILNNKAAEKIYGNLTGKCLLKDFETCKRVVETGDPIQREVFISPNWHHQTIVKIEDGVSITSHNISAAHRYLTLFNNMIQGFCIIEVLFDKDGTANDYLFLEANPVFEIQTGLRNAIGKRMTELQPAHETHWYEVYGKVLSTRQSIHFENEASALKGGIWYDVFAFPHGAPSSNQVAVFFNDITDRKRHQFRQEFLLALSDSLRPLSDPVAIQEAASRAIAELLGTAHAFYVEIDGAFKLQSEYLQPGAPSLIGEYSAEEYAWILPLLQKGETLVLDDLSAYAAKVAALVAVPLVKNSMLVGAFCVAEQIPRTWGTTETDLVKEAGERIWAAVERARAEQALKEMLQQKDIFISIASHELKTPVTSMKVYAEIVETSLEEEGFREEALLVQRLNKQIDNLTALINHLLDTSRISGGQLQLNLEKTDIRELLQEKITDIQLTTTHQLLLQTPELPHVLLDRERISQVITNLFANAIRYSPKGSAITIHGREIAGGVEISISDEGDGITHEDQAKIFDRFFRGTSTQPGMGLGLYITAQIIQRHNGNIRVESEPGKGATFYFSIPS